MLVSIITVSFNSALTIDTAIRSVLDQTHKDIEYWIIDGASKDNTVDIANEYQPYFNGRLHVISEPDGGIYDAMNKGIRQCTGDIVGILNSDDFYTQTNILEKVVEAFQADEYLDVVYGDVHYVHPDNLSRTIRYYSARLYRPWMAPYGFMPPHPSLFVRREVYYTYGLYVTHFKISADFEFFTRILYCNHASYRYLPLDMVTMRTGGASTDSFRSHMRGTEEDLIACRNLGISTNRVKIFSKYIFKILSAIHF